MLKKVRIDKWLWSVRIFKTRTQATDACKSGKVKIGEKVLKASYLVTRDEIIFVRKNSYNFTYKVIDLIQKRVSATLAEPCYENLTPEEELTKFNDWYVGKGKAEQRAKGEGRPTKKDRRNIDRMKWD